MNIFKGIHKKQKGEGSSWFVPIIGLLIIGIFISGWFTPAMNNAAITSNVNAALTYLSGQNYVAWAVGGLSNGQVPYASGGALAGESAFTYNSATNTLTVDSIDSPIGRTSIVVAASDAPSNFKAQADYVCDGIADDVQIQVAIDALPVGGGSVVLSNGTFYISSPINIVTDGVAVRGQNSGEYDDAGLEAIGTRLLSTDAVSTFKLGETGGALVNQTTLEYLFLDGNHTTPTGKVGIEINNAIDMMFTNIVIRNFTDQSILGKTIVATDQVSGIYASKIIADQITFLPTNTGEGTLWAIFFTQSWTGGFHVGNSTHIFDTLEDVRIDNSYLENIALYGSTSDTLLPQFTLSDVIVQTSTDNTMVAIHDASNSSINGIKVYHKGTTATDKTGIYLDECLNFTLSNFNVTSKVTSNVASLARGVDIENSGYVSVSSGVITNISTFGLITSSYNSAYSNIVLRNVGQGNAGSRDAFRLQASAQYNTVTAIRIIENAVKNIIRSFYLDGASNNNIITDCIVDYVIVDTGTDNIIYRNIGYLTENSGTATLLAGTTVIAVTHGLAVTPSEENINLIPLSLMGNASYLYVSNNATATYFWVNSDVDPSTANITFGWDYRH